MSARLIAAVAATLVAGVVSGPTWGQAFPSKPIRILPGGAGGGGHVQILAMKEMLQSRLGQPLIVENTAANLMGVTVARAQPDGYTLMAAGDTVWFAPLLGERSYDTLKDFAAVSGMGISPLLLVVPSTLPVTSVKELIALAKSKPGTLNFSSSTSGSSYHLAGELFKSMTGVNIVSVPYSGGAPTVQAVLSGEVQMTFTPSGSVAQFMKTGKLRALAHTGAKPTALAPDLPSMADAGVPGYEYATVNALFASAKTPANVIRRLNQEFVWVLNQPEVKEKFLGLGSEVYPNTPEEMTAAVKSKYEAIGKLIKEVGITVN